MTPLTPADRDAALRTLPGWRFDEGRRALFRRFQLADFSTAFALMTRIALLAEAADHHPEWSNVYNRIDIWLTTHDAGGISTRDVTMAGRINALLD